MKIRTTFYALIYAGLISSAANAATIELNDGRSLNGTVTSHDDKYLILDLQGIEVKLLTNDIASIDFTDSGAGAATESNQAAGNPQSEVRQETETLTADNQAVEVPAGTVLTIRMSESVNTRKHQTGQRFSAVLEANLMSGDTVVAKRGSTVYGKLTQVKKAGRVAGSATMDITLTSVLIGEQMFDIQTNVLSSTGANTAGSTVGKTARAAAIGGLINGSSGAKNGAKVGVGASLLSQGNDIELPKDSLIDFTLAAPLTS